ncbi:hypothetical protein WM24_23635 [Burkholderia ubonensis]|uniref:HNH endonuclease n=1 Tax=Burkholderia ubonensis TaxID=101571 RepID=UPI000757ED24|nr:HNH endonuclease [Burkholderia ubonensis]KWN80831.1 hypothetical protein WM24_23635 [Burkholderia ubonensis]
MSTSTEIELRDDASAESAAAIITSQGKVALLDAEDLALVMDVTWFCNSGGYMQGRKRVDGQRKTILMHREVMRLMPGDKRVVDHINGNRSDNRKSNLRICTNAENQRNRGKNKNNTSGFKGVTFHKFSRLWKAMIKVDGKDIFLGYYRTPEEAHEAYCSGAEKYHGRFAKG